MVNGTNFIKKSNLLLKQINQLSLSWCKCFHYGSRQNPGSIWVSENYLGFGFVSKSILSILYGFNGDFENLCDLFWCYNTLICHVMQKDMPTKLICDKVGSLSKIFLSIFNLVEKNNTSDSQSKIETAACVINVLTIHNEMRSKGIQRNYWEGGYFGEGGFRFIKPLIQRGINLQGVFVSTVDKMYRLRCINNMILNDDTLDENGMSIATECTDDDIFDSSRYRRFHCYTSIETVLESIENFHPVSVFFHKPTKKFYVCIVRKKKKWLMDVMLEDFKTSFNVSTFVIVTGNVDSMKAFAEVSLISEEYTSVLMLPICCKKEEEKYYAISDEHMEWQDNNQWKLPSIHIDETLKSITKTTNFFEENIKNMNLWDTNEKIENILGKRVIPKENHTIGIITSCYFHNNVPTDENARWTVTYYDGMDVECDIIEEIIFNCKDITDIILI